MPMDTDNKTANNITGGEKDTLHNAGVDLSSTEEKTETFVDIDSAPASKDDADLKDIGINFVAPENKEDLSALKEKMDMNAVAAKPMAPVAPAPVMPAQKQAETTASASDLEQEFKKTVGQTISVKNESLNEKVFSLRGMLSKIQEKLGLKKTEVQKELDNLKHVKEDIAKGIQNIKELEDSKGKIEDQLHKVETLTGEISNIEKEVAEELKS